MNFELNWNSRQLTHGWQKGLQTFFWGLGFKEEDFDKPQIGIGVPLLEGNLCNVHAYDIARAIQESCRDAGLIGFPFGVPGVSDNLTQGLEGGNASLPSRNVIANGSEMVVSAHCYDAFVGLHHCDKNGPGFAMALARLNVPGLIVSGGSIMPGCYKGKDITILDPYDSLAKVAVGEMDAAEVDEIIKRACPGPGGCGIAASFNTWGICMEAIGLMLPYSSSHPAVSDEKQTECLHTGSALRLLLEKNIRPRDILTRQAFENASATIAAMGGSTNGILHLLALAREAGVSFGLKDIQPILRKTPVWCNFAPRGSKNMVDLHRMGGTPVLLKHLLNAGVIQGDCLTVTGKTMAENLGHIPDLEDGKGLIAPLGKPYKDFADMQICFGNLSPEGMVFKVSSMQASHFKGSALCFEGAKEVQDAVTARKIRPGHVVILRNQGPVACGMPEVLVATSALSVPELEGKVAIISDTRVSGVSHGAIGVHCSPEAAVGGPIGCVEDGDTISFDLLKGEVTLHVSDETLKQRQNQIKPSGLNSKRIYLADFSATVTQAHDGCVSKAVRNQG